MNERTEMLMKSFKPRVAVVVYNSTLVNDTYLESHPIDDNGRLLEGRPLKQETIDGIVDVFFDEQQNRSNLGGFIPFNLLKFDLLPGGHYDMIWFRPAEIRHLFFVDGLHIPSGKAPVPAMLYRVNRRDLSVYALASDDRPTGKTKLYRAPFHNVYETGTVCLGSAMAKKPVDKEYTSSMKYWEDIFWCSEFSHLQDVKNPTRTNVNSLWKKLIATPSAKWSEINELLPLKEGRKILTLEDIIDGTLH